MYSVRFLCFVLFPIVFQSVQSKLTCNFEYKKCMTIGAQNIYKILTEGVKDLIEPIDPLFVDVVDAQLPQITYHVRNATLKGLKDCTVELFKNDEINRNYELDLHCPKLDFNYHYEAKGVVLSTVDLDGQGPAHVTVDDYYIKMKGDFKRFISLKDQKSHIAILTHNIETQLKGKIKFEMNEQIHPDKAKSDAGLVAINEDSQGVEPLLRSPFLERFMGLFVERLNKYMENYSIDEDFPKLEKKGLLDTGLKLPLAQP